MDREFGYSKYRLWGLFLGVVASVGLAVLAAVLAESRSLSIVVGLTSLLLVGVLDIRLSLVDNTASLMRGLGARALVEKSKAGDEVTRILGSLEKIDEIEDSVLALIAEETISRCATDLGRLEDGYAELPSTTIAEVATNLTNAANEEVFGASLVDNRTFWKTIGGKAYLEANRRAKDRGVEVRRVLLLNDTNSVDEEAITWIDTQQAAGVTVLIAFTETLPDELVVDFAVYDNSCAIALHFGGETSRIQRANYYSRTHPEFARYQTIRLDLTRQARDAREILEETASQSHT